MQSSIWDADRTREQTLRRRYRARGLDFVKLYGQTCWVLVDRENHALTARVFYTLDAAAAALEAGEAGAG